MNKRKHSTKQRILAEALNLFSVRGFESVTVAEIADAVGIKAPSLYRHYESKQEIFNAILVEMQASYERQAASMQMNGVDAGKDKALFLGSGEDNIIKMSIGLFLYFIHDENVCKFRKMLAIEQYNNKELAAQYAKQYIDFPISYQSAVFGLMVGAGAAITADSQIMALQYYAPVYLYMTLCDCQPEREAEALMVLEQHFRQRSEERRVGKECRSRWSPYH